MEGAPEQPQPDDNDQDMACHFELRHAPCAAMGQEMMETPALRMPMDTIRPDLWVSEIKIGLDAADSGLRAGIVGFTAWRA